MIFNNLELNDINLEKSVSVKNFFQPEISFIIPFKNAGKYIVEAIDSIFNQSGDFRVKEILIIDDSSDDQESLYMLDKISNRQKVKIVENTNHPGPAGARNTGIALANSDWIGFLDADDVLLEDSIQSRIEALKVFPDAELISADFQYWWPDRNLIESSFFFSRERSKEILKQAFLSGKPMRLIRPYHILLNTSLCSPCASLVKRDLLVTVGGFEESLRYKEDHHLFIRLSSLTDIIFVPKSVFLYRRHQSNMTGKPSPPRDYEYAMILQLLLSNLIPELRSEFQKKLIDCRVGNAIWYREKNCFSSAIYECLKGLVNAPIEYRLYRQLVASILRIR